MPAPALLAYRFAETVMQRADPACAVDWSLLAAIGYVESDHGRHGGADVLSDGTSTPPIMGPRLDGDGDVAAIPDTDDGRLDRDRRWDRAVGPMQFIPSTWAVVGSDADGDGARDPHDLDDAALSAAAYLCAGEDDLGTRAGQRAAVLRYNPSVEYTDLVLRLAAAYARLDSVSLALPETADPGTPVNVPTLDRVVNGPAHPATPPRRGTQRLPVDVRRAGDDKASARTTHARPAPASDPGNGDGMTATSRRDPAGSAPRRDNGAAAGDGGGADDAGGGTRSDTDGASGSVDRDSGSTSADSEAATGGQGGTQGGTQDGVGNDTDGEQPATSESTGVLDRAADGSWTVGGTVVDVGDEAYLEAEARHDFDGTDGVESNLGELETLVGQEVHVALRDDVVQELNGLSYR
jgi:hypothetical protein